MSQLALALSEQELRDIAFRNEVLAGLSATPKRVAPKYFYDARGSRIFERICALPDYYLTRAELEIMTVHAQEMARLLGPEVQLVELGSGAGRKSEPLLAALTQPVAYVPVDLAPGPLQQTAERIQALHPALEVLPLCADFTGWLEPPRPQQPPRRVVAYFPGSTIGNLEWPEAVALLRHLKRLVRPGGALLLGADLKKDPAMLERAYNDPGGITAAFNLNILLRINRELGADFELSAFRHRAFYNPARSRIEMHLESLRDQRVHVGRRRIQFLRGESIHTENCYKFAPEDIAGLGAQAGFTVRRLWQDAGGLFCVYYLVALATHPA